MSEKEKAWYVGLPRDVLSHLIAIAIATFAVYLWGWVTGELSNWWQLLKSPIPIPAWQILLNGFLVLFAIAEGVRTIVLMRRAVRRQREALESLRGAINATAASAAATRDGWKKLPASEAPAPPDEPQFNADEKVALRALASADGGDLMAEEVAQQAGIPVIRALAGLESLLERDYVNDSWYDPGRHFGLTPRGRHLVIEQGLVPETRPLPHRAG